MDILSKSGEVLSGESEGQYILTVTKTLAAKRGFFKKFFKVPKHKIWLLKGIWKPHTMLETPIVLRVQETIMYLSEASTMSGTVRGPNLLLEQQDEIGLMTTGKRADKFSMMSICVEIFDSSKMPTEWRSIRSIK